MSTGFQQQPFVPQQQQPMPSAGDASRAQQPGEMQMPTNVGQRQGYPQWDSSAAMAQRVQQPPQGFLPPQQQPQQPQSFQQAPQFPQQQNGQGFQPAPQGFNPMQGMPQGPAPQQQMPRPQYQVPVQMGPDPAQGMGGQPYQFNDGLQLGGPVGGGQAPMQPAPQYPGQQPQQFTGPGQQTQVPVPQSAQIRDSLAAQGLPVGHYANDQQLLADLGSAASEIQQLRHFARMGMMQQRGIPGDGQQQQQPPANGQQQPPAGQQQAQQPQRPRPPEWREEWQALVKFDQATGQYKAVDPMAVNPQIVDRANEYAAWRRRTIDSLAADPAKAVWDGGLSEIVTAEVDRRLQAAEAQRMAQQTQLEGQRAMDQFIQANQQQFFQLDANGQPLVNPYTQEFVLTPRGQSFRAHSSRYSAEFSARYGRAPDPRDVLERTQLALLQEDYQRSAQAQQAGMQQFQQQPGTMPMQPGQWAPPAQYQPIAGGYGPFNQNAAALENTVQQALQRARHAPNQNGTEISQAVNGVAQNPNLSFRQLLQQAAVQRGLA